MEEFNERRGHVRMKLKGYTADIADGHFIYGGVVSDISLNGLRLHDLPEKFAIKGWKYSVVLCGGGPDSVCYKITVCPCWQKKDGFSSEVGFRIAEAPAAWKSFVQKMLPKGAAHSKKGKDNDCIWDQYTNARVS